MLAGFKTSPNGVSDRAAEPSEVYTLTVILDGEKHAVPCRDNETVLVAMERAGLAARSVCHTGRCGFCRSRVLAGEYTVESRHDTRTDDDKAAGIICPCCTYPESDIIMTVPVAR